jgi:hypothetical protein
MRNEVHYNAFQALVGENFLTDQLVFVDEQLKYNRASDGLGTDWLCGKQEGGIAMWYGHCSLIELDPASSASETVNRVTNLFGLLHNVNKNPAPPSSLTYCMYLYRVYDSYMILRRILRRTRRR